MCHYGDASSFSHSHYFPVVCIFLFHIEFDSCEPAMKDHPKRSDIDSLILRELVSSRGHVAFNPLHIASAIYRKTGQDVPIHLISERFFEILSKFETMEEVQGLLSKTECEVSRSTPQKHEKRQSPYEKALKHKRAGAHNKATVNEDETGVGKEKLLACLDHICSSHYSDIFLQPVDSNIFMSFNQCYEGPYITRIFHPMDLGSIRQMIESGSIRTWRALTEHLTLISANCTFFNAPDSEFPKRAKQFSTFFYSAIDMFAS